VEDDMAIWVIEPDQSEKRDLAADRLTRGGQRAAHIPPPIGVSDLKRRIRKIRETARDDSGFLAQQLQTVLERTYPRAKVTTASDSAEAVKYIVRNAGASNVVSTNNSVAVQELRPGLIENGLTVINSYHHEFTVNEKKIRDYWDLPRLLDKNLQGTFDVAIRMDALPDAETRKYVALLGVNAASADDGTVLFVEHFSNIRKDLEKAESVVLVVGLDKIVATSADAVFQAQCMGIFGMENILLGIEPRPETTESVDHLALPAGGARELHVIILDNGRSDLLGSMYADLFLCIGCRACNKHCPIRHAFADPEFIWTPKTYLTRFLRGEITSVDVCLHCEACRIECPVDIDLPYLMWQAKLDYIERHGISFSHKILGRPEVLAKTGTAFGPVANWAVNQKIVRAPMESITGIDRKTKLPTFHHQTFRKRLRRNGSGGPGNGQS
jgi:L-lactate utilization protein LutB